jgi:hypothetical protein
MRCQKCQLLHGGGVTQGHADLKHVATRVREPAAAPSKEALTDAYQCVTCGTRWERDFDPGEGPGYSAFREVT